jgi:hypothetical protein
MRVLQRNCIVFIFLYGCYHFSFGQHEHSMPGDSMTKDPKKKHLQHMVHDSMKMDMMTHAYSINLSMFRNGSGTSWSPDATPMYGYMIHAKKWMFMFHGNIFVRFNYQDFTQKGIRGDYQFDAPNWLMFMGQRKFGKRHLFHFNTMFSLDGVFAQGQGYPLLFQSGEAFNGQPIVDRQHPHDLFSELSFSYAFAITRKMDVFVYLAYPGEPALGPVAFMHRPSALYNPDAPLSHHWIDATHITFGVGTIGFRYQNLKLEGSIFNGREPNQERFGFDQSRFNSWSIRLSYNPIKYLALQISHGFLKSPELLHPDQDVRRTTASAQFSMPFLPNHWLNAIAIWGMNSPVGDRSEQAFLLEAAWQFKRLAVHSRYEFVQKSTHELNLNDPQFPSDALFPVNALTIGLNYDVLKLIKTRLAVGGQFTTYFADRRLDVLYGKNPMAFEIYIRIYPELIKI